MSAWGWQCQVCQTTQRIDRDRFEELVDMFNLAIDEHRRFSPACRPPLDKFVFKEWKHNPDGLQGKIFRKVQGQWRTLSNSILKNGSKK